MAQKKAVPKKQLKAEVDEAVRKHKADGPDKALSEILGHNVKIYYGKKGFENGTLHSLDYQGYVVVTTLFHGRHKVGKSKKTGEYTRTVLIPKEKIYRIQATKSDLVPTPADDYVDTEGFEEVKPRRRKITPPKPLSN